METNTSECKDVKCFDEMDAIMNSNHISYSGVKSSEVQCEKWFIRTDVSPNNTDVTVKLEDPGLQVKQETGGEDHKNWFIKTDVSSPTNTNVAVKLEEPGVEHITARRKVEYSYYPQYDQFTDKPQTTLEKRIELFHEENILLNESQRHYTNNPEDTEEVNSFQFPQCKISAGQKSCLIFKNKAVHLNSNLKTKQLQCAYCEFRTAIKKSLKRHIDVMHFKVKPFHCSHCEFSASTKTILKYHIEVLHLNVKRYHCPHCDYRTGRKGHLKRHIIVMHLKVKNFQCPYCEFRAAQKGNLNKHIQAIHLKLKPFPCPHCEFRAKRKDHLNRHIKTIHLKVKPFQCSHYDFKAGQIGILNHHLMKNLNQLKK